LVRIGEQTVLILGAGASAPYGYPTGEKLKADIISGLGDDSSDLFRVLCDFNQAPALLDELRDGLYYADTPSIDVFLEHNPHLLPVGKLAISALLVWYEAKAAYGNSDWYQYLYRYLTNGLGPLEDFEAHRLSVVTFNYDRSLEHYWFTALQKLLNESEERVANTLARIPIVHFHGSLGMLPWQPAASKSGSYVRPYGVTEPQGIVIPQSANCINIIHEVDPLSHKPLDTAVSLLEDADHIVILGFGFHGVNVRRLRLLDRVKEGRRRVVASAFGQTSNEIDALRDALGASAHPPNLLNIQNLDCLGLLREVVSFR
jgi:hypothetical protein